MGLRARAFLIVIVPLITLTSILSYYVISTRMADIDQALINKGDEYAKHLAVASEYGVFSANTRLLDDLIMSVFGDPDVYSVTIYNIDNQVLSSSVSPYYSDLNTDIHLDFDEEYMRFTYPVHSKTIPIDDNIEQIHGGDNLSSDIKALGFIDVVMTTLPNQARNNSILINGLIIFLLGLLLILLLTWSFGANLVRPIERLQLLAKKLSAGTIELPDEPFISRGELGDLEKSFFEMAHSIKDSQTELSRQIEQATSSLKKTIAQLETKNQELDIAREEAIKSGREKTDFMARMSHEIRTPINSIIGFMSLIKKSGLAKSQQEYFRIIDHASRHLLSLINDILYASKIGSGKFNIEMQPFDLRSLVEDATLFMSPAAHQKELELVFMLNSDVPTLLMGDQYHIRQILINLLNNAIKFTDRGEVVVNVSLLNEDDEKARIMLTVSDTGMGIDAQQIDRIYEPFYQSDTTKSRRHEGVGLGLSIVQSLVSLMDGVLEIKSQAGEGSSFSVTINFQKQLSQVNAVTQQLTGYKILCYDSHSLALRSLRNQVLHWTYRVYTASSLERMASMIDHENVSGNPFDIILIGINKMESQSPEIINEIKQFGKIRSQPAIVLLGDEKSCSSTLFDDDSNIVCTAKPISYNHLFATLCQCLSISDTETSVSTAAHPGLENKYRVLFAEDNYFNRLLISTLLSDNGFSVSEAHTGPQALSLASEQEFDIILMDIHLPELDGLEVSRQIRSLSAHNKRTPIIALTADVFISDDRSMEKSGINDLVTKPVNEVEFWEKISRWTGFEYHQTVASNVTADQHLLQRLLDELPNHLELITESVAARNIDILREQIHQLKGMAGYFQLHELAETVSRAERIALLDGVSFEEIEPFILQIEQQVLHTIDSVQVNHVD